MEFPVKFNRLTIHNIENPRWSGRDQIQIDVDLTAEFPDGRVETFPYTACPFDTWDDHCPPIFEYAANMPGIGEWQRPDVTWENLQADLDKLMPDIVLGLATDDEISLAKNLRTTIKAMQAADKEVNK